ncbi:MAG: hypothetical protein Q4F65_12545 [Propionibacteriaceae bacterium]|nr:hypothetical protein [Propionibacteriaceae bacterium]
MVTDPSTCKPDEVWAGRVYDDLVGGREVVLVRWAARATLPWCAMGGGYVNAAVADDDVTLLHRLVPARDVTRDDLPGRSEATSAYQHGGVAGVLDAVVEHINSRGGLPAARPRPTEDVEHQMRSTETQRDYWRRKFESMRDEHARQAQAWSEKRDAYEATIAELEGERDRALADCLNARGRAEKAGRELADPLSQTNQNSAAWNRVMAHPALRMDLLPESGSYADRVFERITWLAEAAEAETVLAGADDDPVALAVRESEIAAVEVRRDGDDYWVKDGDEPVWLRVGRDAVEVRGRQHQALLAATRHEAVARAIEAEPDADARRMAGATCEGDWEALPESVREAWRQEAAK